MRNPSLIHSSLSWIIRDQLGEIGQYLISGFLDDLLGLGNGKFATTLLCKALLQLLDRLCVLYHTAKSNIEPTS